MLLRSIRYSDIEKYPHYFKLAANVKENFFGSSPAPFIGRYGYPDINVGLLAPQETSKYAWLHDAPRYWSEKNFSINSVADLRLSLINSICKANIRTQEKIALMAQEIGLAKRPVDIEINLEKKPSIKPLADRIVAPMGPSGKIKTAKITENPRIPVKVQKVHDDTDLKADDAIKYLYKNDIDENYLTRILSVGSIGLKNNRKLVPTRWSITAIDDNIGKDLIKRIKEHNPSDYKVHYGSFFGNYFIVIFLPETWSYELFEMYMPRYLSSKEPIDYSTDHEFYEGRKTYAENCAGGYYASRLPILEKLIGDKRQASVLVLRFITPEDKTPLGVWVVREAVRKAMQNKPFSFTSEELLLNYVKRFVKVKFGFDVSDILGKSRILNEKREQRRLSHFVT